MTDLPVLVLLAAGRSTRYGQPKQLAPLGPGGASLMAYTLVDGFRSGFGRAVVITSRDLRPRLEAHLASKLGANLPIDWCHQDLDDLPDDLSHLASRRRKPWGTGHAVLSAADQLSAPFAVANADDWYGPEAWAALARWLQRPPPEGCSAATVGYPMEATLSPSGGVSRGLIEADPSGQVRRVVELMEVRRGGAGGMLGIDPEGRQIRVPAGTPASMNLWGFHPCVLPLLREGFRSFLTERGSDDSTEYALSTAVDRLLEDGALSLHLLSHGRRWFGVTHMQDTEGVQARLEALHREGTYSTPLKDSLPALRS
ncbi:MAG: NTP transferase domain-containing protein [Gemmatimonadales bacterium]|nr:MAG: NTP transferase domain-containing protein [Gemmatimonadales bacterium]